MSIDWRAAERDLAAILSRHYDALTQQAVSDVAADLGRAVTPDERTLAWIADSAADRAHGMVQTQQDRIAALTDQYADDPDGLQSALDAAASVADRKAASVAATETTWAYNSAVVTTVQADGNARLYCTDGDGDPACAEVNGTYVTAEWALDNPLGHPNCTRRFLAEDGAEA